MGSLCCTHRKGPPDPQVEAKKEDSNKTLSDTFTEANIKDIIDSSYRSQCIDDLVPCIVNKSEIILTDSNVSIGWISKPKNVGELALVHILNIIRTRLQNNYSSVTKKYQSDKQLSSVLQNTKLIPNLLSFLDGSYSSCKFDCAITIVCLISTDRLMCIELQNKKTLTSLLKYCHYCYSNKIKNHTEHIVIGLETMRYIYLQSVELRKNFVELDGLQLLYELLNSNNEIIVQEVLINIEDLIYEDQNEDQFYSISKVLIGQMVKMLIQNNIKKVLQDLCDEVELSKEDHEKTTEELNRLTYVFFESQNIIKDSEENMQNA